jgi:hypothetical protein
MKLATVYDGVLNEIRNPRVCQRHSDNAVFKEKKTNNKQPRRKLPKGATRKTGDHVIAPADLQLETQTAKDPGTGVSGAGGLSVGAQVFFSAMWIFCASGRMFGVFGAMSAFDLVWPLLDTDLQRWDIDIER